MRGTMDKYLGIFLIMVALTFAAIFLTGCGTPSEAQLLYWSALETQI